MGAMQVSNRFSLTTTTFVAETMQLVANDWIEPTYDSVANFTFQPPTPSRNDTTDGFFQTFRIGVCHQSQTPHLTPHTAHLTLLSGGRRVCRKVHTTGVLLVQQRQSGGRARSLLRYSPSALKKHTWVSHVTRRRKQHPSDLWRTAACCPTLPTAILAALWSTPGGRTVGSLGFLASAIRPLQTLRIPRATCSIREGTRAAGAERGAKSFSLRTYSRSWMLQVYGRSCRSLCQCD